jgi:hypothetical protein
MCAWADTTTAHGRLLPTVLGGLAEFERELIRTRRSGGRARAKANGKSLGRPFKMTSHQRKEALARRESGELLTEIARSYNFSAATISRLAWANNFVSIRGAAMDTAKVKDALVQIALRMVPFLPGNELKLLLDALVKKDSEIETQVGEAVKSLQSTAAIVSTLEVSLKEKTDRLKSLQTEYENYSKLTELTREQIKSLSIILKSTLAAERKWELLIAISLHVGVGLIFLILGVVLAEPIKKGWEHVF